MEPGPHSALINGYDPMFEAELEAAPPPGKGVVKTICRINLLSCLDHEGYMRTIIKKPAPKRHAPYHLVHCGLPNWDSMLPCNLLPSDFEPELLVRSQVLHHRLLHCWAHVPPDGSPAACVMPSKTSQRELAELPLVLHPQ